jgi:hypothetical protein
MQTHSAHIFNTVVIATLTSISMVGNADAISVGGRGGSIGGKSFSFTSAPKAPVVAPAAAPKPAAPAAPVTPAKSTAPATPAKAVPYAEPAKTPTAAKPTNEPVQVGAQTGNNLGQKKQVPTTTPRHDDDHYYGYHYYNWFYARPTNITPFHSTGSSSVSADPIMQCMKDRLYSNGISVSEIQRNAAKIQDLRRSFDTAQHNDRSVSTAGLNMFDRQVLKAYKDCTRDW